MVFLLWHFLHVKNPLFPLAAAFSRNQSDLLADKLAYYVFFLYSYKVLLASYLLSNLTRLVGSITPSIKLKRRSGFLGSFKLKIKVLAFELYSVILGNDLKSSSSIFRPSSAARDNTISSYTTPSSGGCYIYLMNFNLKSSLYADPVLTFIPGGIKASGSGYFYSSFLAD